MLNRRDVILLGAATCVALPTAANAQATPGQPAPAFTATDVNGRTVSLADFRGKTVVLEWNNPACPFVRKHYDSGNMQGLQKQFAGNDVVWLAVNSTAAGHGEYLAPAAWSNWFKDAKAAPTAALMDSDGKIGRSYGARTTPHMYVIDPQGRVVYAGAIDDKRSANPADVKGARNYVAQALTELRAGKPVSVASTVPYGCSVKY